MAKEITIKNAHLIWRNFRGEGSDFNPAGKRNFAVVIDDEDMAKQLINDGWNLKLLKPRDEDDTKAWALKVQVKYGVRPPKIKLCTYPNGKLKTTDITEETVDTLDWAEIEKVDLTISPYEYTVRGQSGISAYLKIMYFTPVEDELSREYTETEMYED